MIIRCKTCVYPTTKPDLMFQDGQCQACINYRNRPRIDWRQREQELIKVLERSRKSRHNHDCIVPSSGGKDSTAQVLKIIELGFKPLVVTATTCHLTEIGRQNIANLKLHADTIEVDPDPEARAKLNVLGMELVGDISWPEHAAIFSIPFRAAVDYGMDLIVYGECPQREYGGPINSESAMQMTRRWVDEFGGLLGLRPSDFVGHLGLTEANMQYYTLPSDAHMVGLKAIWLGQFVPWDSHANASKAITAGMKYILPSEANHWPWENLDNAQTGLHDHMMYRKYGYGRLAGQVSVDIRSGRMSREMGIKLVEDYDGKFPFEYMGVKVEEVLDRLGRDMNWVDDCMTYHTDWSLFESYVVNKRPKLKAPAVVG